jgi:riboflavin synthase
MFTGIVESLGTIVALTPKGGDVELLVESAALFPGRTQIGDSVSVSGACLTVTRLERACFAADVSTETLALTTLGALVAGARVNLERALRAGDALGGHYVSGHVDGLARLAAASEDARSLRLTFAVPDSLARYLAPKGSVTLAGVSLTVNEVEGSTFGVNLIPHTRAVTTLGTLKVGDRVNFEADTIARYVERLLTAGR